MSKLVKLITVQLEEFLSNSTDLSLEDDKSNKDFIVYRLSLFKTVFFSIMYKKVSLLKNNILKDPEIIKNTMVLFNTMVDEINTTLLELEFLPFHLELTKPEIIPVIVKKNPFKHLVKDIMNPETPTSFDTNRLCKPLNGMLSFVIYHKTKTKTELSINVLSDSKSISNSIQFKDVTQLIELKNHHIVKELEEIVVTNLKPIINSNILKYLGTGLTYKEVESKLYFGFLGTLTLDPYGEKDDINEIIDMFYYPDKPFLPYFKLYYSIFQYKKETAHYIYKDINDIETNKFISILKQDNIPYNGFIVNRPCLFFNNGDGILLDRIILKIKNPMKFRIEENQGFFEKSCKTNKIKVSVRNESKLYKLFLGSKEILYNNIRPKSQVVFINKTTLLPSYIFYTRDVLNNNTLFNKIQQEFILTNNEVLRHKDNEGFNDKIDLLFKINPTHMPWDKFILFLGNDIDVKSYDTPQDIYDLICLFKKTDESNGKKIIEMLLYTPLSKTFNDIYSTQCDELEDFQKFYLDNFFINSDCILEQVNENIEQKKIIYKDFLFILEVILLIIKSS